MKLNLALLEKVRQRGSKIIACCPACAEMERDRTGDRLVIFPSGLFACAAHQGDREHAHRILQLAGSHECSAGHSQGLMPQHAHTDFPASLLRHKVVQDAPPPSFSAITLAARRRLSDSEEAQARIASEFGVRVETILRIGAKEGRIGLFSDLSIGGRLCLPDRIGYIYPQGVKIRHP